MKRYIIILFFIIIAQNQLCFSEEYFIISEQIILQRSKNEIPQAPRISPDGNKLLYELYSKEKCEIWICDSNGKNNVSLTKPFQSNQWVGAKAENAFWHPSGEYITFNEMPEGIRKKGRIIVAKIEGARLNDSITIDVGARPQFSKPYGHVIFYEFSSESSEGIINNILVYRILGKDPMAPMENRHIELRGPIQKISKNTELSHPSLAPDGTTILFAARTSATSGNLSALGITDSDRQRSIQIWKKIINEKNSTEKIKMELTNCTNNMTDVLNIDDGIDTNILQYLIGNIRSLERQSTLVKGFNRRDFVICWLTGLLNKLNLKYEKDFQNLLYSRVWMTDVFGAPIVALANDESNVPLPQKWATVSKSGRFAIFEAGHYQNRHLYLANMKTHKAIKLTSLGTYNSSPEISPDEQWVYFESNRDNKKAIWRAKLDMEKISKEVGLE